MISAAQGQVCARRSRRRRLVRASRPATTTPCRRQKSACSRPNTGSSIWLYLAADCGPVRSCRPENCEFCRSSLDSIGWPLSGYSGTAGMGRFSPQRPPVAQPLLHLDEFDRGRGPLEFSGEFHHSVVRAADGGDNGEPVVEGREVL